MPCYTERKVTVELQAANQLLLLKGLETLQITTQTTRQGLVLARAGRKIATLVDGKLELEYGVNVSLVNEIKRAYSVQVVYASAKRYGWTVNQQKEDEFLIHRRF